MIKLKTLLKENPDTVRYAGGVYRYDTPANRSAFFVYKDRVTNKEELFGYSDIKEDFFASDPDLLKKLENFENTTPSDPDDDRVNYIRNVRKDNNGGGHGLLEHILDILGRCEDVGERGRIFEVKDEEKNKVIICSFWSKKDEVLKYLHFWKQAIEFNGYKPEDIIYEPYKQFYTYEQFIDPNFIIKPNRVYLNTGDSAKVGDKVVYLIRSNNPLDPRNPIGIITDITDETEVTIKIIEVKQPDGGIVPNKLVNVGVRYLRIWKEELETKIPSFSVGDDVQVGKLETYAKILSISTNGKIAKIKITRTSPGVSVVGAEFDYPTMDLKKVTDKDISEEPIRPILDGKIDMFVEKRGQLHTTAARLTPQEKQNLEREVDKLDLEINKLQSFINNGIYTLSSERKQELEQYVNSELVKRHAEKKDRYSLITQAEKQYGMPIAQIRQKFRGIPLDKLVKKESLYKRIMWQQIMLG